MPDTRRNGEYGQRRRSTSPGEKGNEHGERRTAKKTKTKKVLEPTTTIITIIIIITIPTQIKSDINNNNPTSHAA